MAKKSKTRRVDFVVECISYLETHTQILVLDLGSLNTAQLQTIRKNLANFATLLQGKNTLISKAITLRLEDTTKTPLP